MKSLTTRALMAGAAAIAIIASPAFAKEKPLPATTMTTVYISAHGGSTIAKKMNEMHAKMEAQGWRFADMEIHTENADTEGAIVTYVK